MLALLGLACAHSVQGEATKAQAAYLGFIALSRDADPDVPILKEAKAVREAEVTGSLSRSLVLGSY